MNGTALFAIVLPPLTISRNALLGVAGRHEKLQMPSASLTTPTGFPPNRICAPAGTPDFDDDAPADGPTFGSNSRRSWAPRRIRRARAQHAAAEEKPSHGPNLRPGAEPANAP